MVEIRGHELQLPWRKKPREQAQSSFFGYLKELGYEMYPTGFAWERWFDIQYANKAITYFLMTGNYIPTIFAYHQLYENSALFLRLGDRRENVWAADLQQWWGEAFTLWLEIKWYFEYGSNYIGLYGKSDFDLYLLEQKKKLKAMEQRRPNGEEFPEIPEPNRDMDVDQEEEDGQRPTIEEMLAVMEKIDLIKNPLNIPPHIQESWDELHQDASFMHYTWWAHRHAREMWPYTSKKLDIQAEKVLVIVPNVVREPSDEVAVNPTAGHISLTGNPPQR